MGMGKDNDWSTCHPPPGNHVVPSQKKNQGFNPWLITGVSHWLIRPDHKGLLSFGGCLGGG